MNDNLKMIVCDKYCGRKLFKCRYWMSITFISQLCYNRNIDTTSGPAEENPLTPIKQPESLELHSIDFIWMFITVQLNNISRSTTLLLFQLNGQKHSIFTTNWFHLNVFHRRILYKFTVKYIPIFQIKRSKTFKLYDQLVLFDCFPP